MTRDVPSTRRGFLAAAGGTLLAGCSGLDQFSEEPRETIPGHRLPDVADDGDSDPVLVEAIPVEIEQGHLDAAMRRTTDLLGTLPVPLTPAQIPNGHVRQRLVDAADAATTSIQGARTAQTRLSALQSLRNARESARFAAAGWAFVEDGRTRDELQAEHRRAVNGARSLRRNHEYLGTDPVRAALVHARIERNLALVLDERPPRIHESGALLTVAGWGEHAESARALTGDTRHLYDQYTASLPADAGPIDGTLVTAAETLAELLRNRRAELPAEPTEGDDNLAQRIRYRLRDDAASSAERVSRADGPARAVLLAVAGLADFAAYDRVRKRMEGGERFRVENAEEVQTARSEARRAIRKAFERSPRPELARPVLAEAAASVAYADEELARLHGDVRPARLHDPIRQYTIATVRARSVPTACQRVLDALTP